MPNLGWRRRLLHERAGDILEQADQVNFLLVVSSERVARLLSHNGEHRHVIEPRVVEPGSGEKRQAPSSPENLA